MDAITVNNVNLQLPEIRNLEPNELDAIAQRSLDQMRDFLYERAFGYQKRLRPIDEAENSITSSLSLRLSDIFRINSIMEKIPASERQLVAAWLEQNDSHSQLLLDLDDKNQLPLTLDLADEKSYLTVYETLLLVTESGIIKMMMLDFGSNEIPLTQISAQEIRALLSCVRGETVLSSPNTELCYAVSYLEIRSLVSILVEMVQTKLNQAMNIDEIETIISAYPYLWHLVPRQELGDILNSKIRFCNNAEDFGRILNICSFWQTCNMTDRIIELIPTITLPKEADANWLVELAHYRGGLDFSDCTHLVLEHQAWQYLSQISSLVISLPLLWLSSGMHLSKDEKSAQEIVYTDSFCQALTHLVNLEKVCLNGPEAGLDIEEKWIAVLAGLPKIKSVHAKEYPRNYKTRFPFKGLISYSIDHIESLPQILEASPLLESLVMDTCDDSIMEKLLKMNRLEHLDASFDVEFNERKIWQFDQLRLKSLSCDMPIKKYDKFIDQISKISSLTKLNLVFYNQNARFVGNGEVTETTFNPLKNLTDLRELGMSGDSFKANPADALQFISSLTNLKSLKLSCIAGGKVLGYIANKLALEELDITIFEENFDPESLTELEGAVNLKKIMISDPNISSKIHDRHIEVLAGKPIIELALDSSDLTDASAETIKQLTTLRKLKIKSTKVTGQFFQTIAGHLPLLNDLDFRGDFQDAGWEALPLFPNLQHLRLDGQFLTRKAFEELLKIKSLRKINCRGRTLRDLYPNEADFSVRKKLLQERRIAAGMFIY